MATNDRFLHLNQEISEARREIDILRKQITGLRETNKKDVQRLEKLVKQMCKSSLASDKTTEPFVDLSCKPIGYLRSIFKFKNGIPRQPSVCQQARGWLTIESTTYNPEHSLEGLESFNYLWIIFVFHKNNNEYTKAKVKPPRLDGVKVGLFSTRCPYRPNPIGLTLAKIEKIEGSTVYLSGIDILDGTPVLDIKPYISDYDQPNQLAFTIEPTSTSDIGGKQNQDDQLDVKALNDQENGDKTENSVAASWISQPPIDELDIRFTNFAEEQLRQFDAVNDKPFHLEQLKTSAELKTAIINILKADPRSVYRRNHCQGRLYFFCLDNAHVTCWFDKNVAEVVRIQPMAFRDSNLKRNE
ncbi:tRNA (adenine(37)-N6)-methyltransferase-like [Tubulanus polymorphus]|uniref:tRNA (adenine(37)-N6)-methyltransferase-like n=1 Tax=Tubulanus polymorphus TaxID=672921 RepID=UPI003DA6B7A4